MEESIHFGQKALGKLQFGKLMFKEIEMYMREEKVLIWGREGG